MATAVATPASGPKLASVKGVEIFQAGTHRDRTYTVDDLDQMVQNFDALGDLFEPTLVVGHEEDQSFLEDSGIPAAGTVTRLWRDGDGLYADFDDVPPTLARLINGRAYRAVSAEVYDDFEHDGEHHGKALRRVALLGGELPQIKTLNDLPLAEYAERRAVAARKAALRFRGLRPAAGGLVRLFSEVQTVDRTQMIEFIVAKGVPDAIAQTLSDDQLTGVVQAWQAQESAMPGALMGDDDLKAAPPPIQTPAPTPAPAPTPTPQAPPPVPVPNPHQTPSQVTVKYSEDMRPVLASLVAEAVKGIQADLAGTKGDVEIFKEQTKKAAIDARLDVLLKQGKLLPAQIDAGLRDRLYRANAVQKFSDGKTELDKQLAELEAGPALLTFAERMKTGGAGGRTAADADVAALEQHYEVYAEQFRKVGTTKQGLVEAFKYDRERNPRLTFKEYVGAN